MTVVRIRAGITKVRIDPESLFQQNLNRRELGQPLLHRCSVCHYCAEWGPSWIWYGSYRDQDDGTIAKFCSTECFAVEPADAVLQRCRRRPT